VVTQSVVVVGPARVVVVGPTSVVVVVDEVVVDVVVVDVVVDVVGPAVVVVVLDVVVVVVVVELVVDATQGQSRATGCPTEYFKQVSESVAVVGRLPFGAQMQPGAQLSRATEVRRMYRQSVATGSAPADIGWLQSPGPAMAGEVQMRMHTAATSHAAFRECLSPFVESIVHAPKSVRINLTGRAGLFAELFVRDSAAQNGPTPRFAKRMRGREISHSEILR
jgi:hypothetical protein